MKVKQILKNWDYDRIEPKLAVSTTLWRNSQHSPKTSRLLLMLFVSSSWSPDVFVSFTFSLPISKQYRHSSFCTWVPYIPPRTGYGIFLVKTWELEGIYQHSLLSAKLRIVNETWIVTYRELFLLWAGTDKSWQVASHFMSHKVYFLIYECHTRLSELQKVRRCRL